MNDIVDIPLPKEDPPVRKARGWPKGKSRGPKKKPESKSQADYSNPGLQEQLHAVVVMTVGLISMMLAEEIRPTSQEIDMIFGPLERIYLRRFAFTDKITPDMMDGLQALSGIIFYGYRVYTYQQSRPKQPVEATLSGVGDGTSETNHPPAPPGPASVPGSNGLDGGNSWLANYHTTHLRNARTVSHEIYDGTPQGVSPS